MKQSEFLNSLKVELEKNRVLQVDDILRDYQEHFEHGRRNNLSDEEISQKLGSPSTIAKAYEADSWLTQVRSQETNLQFSTILKALGRFLLIAPFNFLMIFIPGMIVVSIVFSGWLTAGSLAAASIAILVAASKASLLALGAWTSVAIFSASCGVLGLAVLTGMLMFVVSKFVLAMILNYIHWNIQFVMQK